MKTISLSMAIVVFIIFWVLIAGLFHTGSVLAQTTGLCATAEQTPEQMAQVQKWADEWAKAGGQRITGITTIPVSVHVVHRSSGVGDVTDQQVYDQINALNGGFLNTDFQFSLCSIDRTSNDNWSDHGYNTQEEIAMKQALAIDPTRILNFYICASIGGTTAFGYARFPWEGLAAYMHGVVLKFSTLPGGSEPNNNLGRWGTHEVGHYVGLYHTFQGGCSGPGDYVSDTPPHHANSGCPAIPNATCNPNIPDPIHNFMNYTNDDCRNEFTTGQGVRMAEQMTIHREEIFNSVCVSVDQKLQDGTRIGNLGRWNGNSFNPRFAPGRYFGFSYPSTEVLHGDTNIVSNQKYQSWVLQSTQDPDVKNHHEFDIADASFVSLLTSQFNPTQSNIIIKTDLIDIPGTTAGTVQFRDPWYIDLKDPNYGNTPRNQGMASAEWHERDVGTEGFKPDYSTEYDGGRVYRGVFLNEEISPGLPYYSVGAQNPQPITVNGQSFNWYFQKWSGASAVFQDSLVPQTPVVFTNAGATATAKFKAHLGSSLATAAAPSTQRKLVQFGSYHHLVYTSSNHIWYTSSSDYGVNWSPEQKVSSIAEGYQNTNPAIDVDGSGNVYVVFEAPTGATRSIAIMKKTISGWEMINIGETFYASAELKPVIAVSKLLGSPKVVVIVRADGYGSANNDPGLYYLQPGFLPSKVSQTSASSLNPTFAYYNLAYQENNAIYHKEVQFGPNPVTFSSRALVSVSYFNGRPLSNISNPNIAVREGGGLDFNSRPVIAWQATDLVFSTYRPIFVRHPVSGGIPPVFVLTVFDWATSNAHGKTPSVNVYQTPPQGGYQNPDVSVVWQDDPSNAYGTYPNVVAANKISGNWGVQSTIATLSASSSVAQGYVSQTPSSGGALIVRAGSSGPPYALTASERTNYGQIEDGPMAKVNSTSVDYARSVNIDLAGAGINGLSGIVTLYIRNAPRFGLRHLRELSSVQEDFLRLQAQSPIADEISYVLSLCDVTIPRGIGNEQLRQRVCALQVSLNGRDFQTLGAITVKDLSALWNTRTSDTIRVVQRERAFSVPAVGHVRFSVEPLFFNNPDHVVLIEEITLQDTSSTRLAKSASHEVLPQAFFLHPNHPNPFNPSTTISFDVPEVSHVSLVVYDVLGRQVAGLVNGSYEAGYHSVTWNASSFASGVYLARFTARQIEGRRFDSSSGQATDASGAVKLSTTQKLVLTK